MGKIASEKEKIAQRIAKLEMKEKLLKEKERRHHTKYLIKLGELLTKSELDQMDQDVLLGALLELKELSTSNERIEKWRERGKHFLQIDEAFNPQPLIISSGTDLPPAIKLALRERKFRWNQFRHEWYGYGKLEDMQEFLKEQKAHVEVVRSEE